MGTLLDLASLVMIPSGVKEDKLYSVKPTDGSGDFTFSRGTDTATRVNSSGLIEKERVNLFEYSEEFNQGGSWSLQGGAQISANASTAPDGTTTADLLYPSIDGAVKAVIQSFASASGTQYAQSVYVKASGKNFVALYTLDGSSGAALWVNLTTGEITDGAGSNVIGRFATSVGNGWWRIGFADLGNGATNYIHIYPTDIAGSQNVTANGTDGILVWGAQMNYGSVAQDYIKTTTAAVYEGITDNLPRLDYSGGASCPSLLLEPSRTNLLNRSELFTDWIRFSSAAVISTNTAISPEGLQNASTFTFSGTGADYAFKDVAITTSGASVFSIYLKVASGTRNIALATGLASNSKVVEVTTEWQRFELNIPSALSNDTIGLDNRASSGGTGTAGDVFAYGAQLEEGSYPTSYIPTYGASASRANDSCSKTGISDLIGQTEGTFFFEIGEKTTEEIAIFEAGQGSAQYRFLIYTDTSNKLKVLVVDNFSVQVSYTSTVNVESNAKIAIAYKLNDYAIYLNGSLLSNDTSASVPPMNQIAVGSDRGGVVTATNNTKQALVFKTRLSNDELAALTTI